MPSAQPFFIGGGILFGILLAVATFIIGRETAPQRPQRASYRPPNPGPRRIISDPTCTICREDILITEGTSLRCGHVFHITCIKTWNRTKLSCPNCNMKIQTPI